MDTYLTIASPSAAKHTEKMSRFLSFAIPVTHPDQVKPILDQYRRQYHDARHICWAYTIGPDRTIQYSNDNGEPSGTAGRPILGQINSADLTDTLIIVVRYFGGIKLGTPGLISAYRQAAALAIAQATIITRRATQTLSLTFPYPALDRVLTLTRHPDITTLSREYDLTCTLTIAAPTDIIPTLTAALRKIDQLTIKNTADTLHNQ